MQGSARVPRTFRAAAARKEAALATSDKESNSESARLEDRQAQAESVLPRVDAPGDQRRGGPTGPLPFLGRAARAWRDLANRDQEAPERQRRRRRRRRGGRLISSVERSSLAPLALSTSPPSPDDPPSFAVGGDGTRLYVHARTAGHAASDVHAILSDGVLCDGFIWKYLWGALAPIVPVDQCAAFPEAMAVAGRSGLTPGSHSRRGPGRRSRPCPASHRRSAPACSSGTRWGARSRSRRTASGPKKVREPWCSCAGAQGNVTSTFHGRPRP